MVIIRTGRPLTGQGRVPRHGRGGTVGSRHGIGPGSVRPEFAGTGARPGPKIPSIRGVWRPP